MRRERREAEEAAGRGQGVTTDERRLAEERETDGRMDGWTLHVLSVLVPSSKTATVRRQSKGDATRRTHSLKKAKKRKRSGKGGKGKGKGCVCVGRDWDFS